MSSKKVLGLCGSLRVKSTNLAALHAAGELMPSGMELSIASLIDIPMYNGDVEAQGIPASVQHLRSQILAADALLIASPEYNFSISGALKNAIDWLSRTSPQPLKDKPAAVMSVTGGPVGGARNQYDLRKILGAMEVIVLPKPEVFIGLNQNKFNAEGRLVDEPARAAIAAQMTAFHAWIGRVGIPAAK